jgi:hypothetical protein
VGATLDDTFYPILLSRLDQPVVRAEAEAYFQKLAALADRAIRRGERYVVIVLSDVGGFSPAGRKVMAEAHASYVTPERNAATLTALVPVDNAIVRGAVTAFRWVAPQLVSSLRPVRSLDAAIDEALHILDENGAPFRGDLQGLRRALGLRPRA